MRSRTQFRARDKIDLITAEAFREIGRRVFRYSGDARDLGVATIRSAVSSRRKLPRTERRDPRS
jgi:hypothetical protein